VNDHGPLPPAEAVEVVLARIVATIDSLGELGEGLEDEWQYVQDLVRIYRQDLTGAVRADPRPVDPLTVRAVDVLIDEARRIVDPHRAIDWLSTFPQAARLALDTRV
jgi:hypothetical protein